VGPQVEVLEHHRHARAQALQLRRVGGLQRAAPAVGYELQFRVAEHDAPAVRLFEQVQATQEGALARARRADHRDHVALARAHAHALEHFIGTEALADLIGFEQIGRTHRRSVRQVHHRLAVAMQVEHDVGIDRKLQQPALEVLGRCGRGQGVRGLAQRGACGRPVARFVVAQPPLQRLRGGIGGPKANA
jgi:hypothetical protein